MIVSINQPAYLPWLGYFHRIAVSDVHIVLDHVQIDHNTKTQFANRNKIRTCDGWTWITVPINTKGLSGQLQLDKITIANNTPWAKKHWTAIRMNYGRASYFAEHAEAFRGFFETEWTLLREIVNHSTEYLLNALGIKTKILFSSQLGIGGSKDELVLNLCRAVGGTIYLSGPFGRDYLREERFADHGIRVVYHDYRHPVYKQAYPGFEPFMSVVDLLFNCGPASRDIMAMDQPSVRP